MLVKFSPEQLDPAKGVEARESVPLADLFEGFVEIKMPSYPERLRFPKEAGIEGLIGQKNEDDKVREYLAQMDGLANCSEKIMPYINAVDLVHKPSGTKLASVDDLFCFPDAGNMVTGLCIKFISGFLEKKS